MLSEEIKNGETQEIEYKRELPERSEKYMKTIVAFANTHGGRMYMKCRYEASAR